MEENVLDIINFIVNKQNKPEAAVRMDQSLRGDLQFDSFDLAELAVRLENAFHRDVFQINYKLDLISEIVELLQEEANQ